MLEVEIAADSPLVAGHFPGRPILPGVAQIALALEALSRENGRAVVAREVSFARFRRIVTPPDRLELRVRDVREGAARIDVTREGVAIAIVEVILGDPQPVADWTTAVASRRVAGHPPIESMLPHRLPMRFVESIVGEAEDGLTCGARVPSGCALVAGGSVPAIVVVEAAAQAAAVWEALRRARAGGGGIVNGYLVSVREVVLHQERVPAEAPLLASVRLTAQAGPLAHYRVAVSCDAEPVLRGTIGVYEGVRSSQIDRKQNH